MDEILHLFLHALKDTLPILPWILLMYILIELLENKTNLKTVSNIVPDCWIYVQDTDVKLGRIQIFKNAEVIQYKSQYR